uniref:BTB_2 domain-containing protein n=1 Tax=Angiostrongylus cantonensis TaxID=6313 RepID=A0A0K0DNF9_ANGCA
MLRLHLDGTSKMKEEVKRHKLDDIIRLNVGGKRFDTFLGTLLVDRSSDIYEYFLPLLEPESATEQQPPKDSEGAVSRILNYYVIATLRNAIQMRY